MNARDYQKQAHAFASYGDNPMYPALGLAEEAGEVCGKVAKFIRKHGGSIPLTEARRRLNELRIPWSEDQKQFREDLAKELGDVLWMIAELCTVYGLDIGDVMRGNLEKLADRKERGVIVGEGDDR